MADDAEFEAEYQRVLDALNQAEHEVSRLVTQAIAQIGNPYLVRGYLDDSRVKAFRSVLKKCRTRGLEPNQLLDLADLVGMRVVCANLEDVDRLVELVKGIGELEVIGVQKKQTADGYRAIHVDVRTSVTTRDHGAVIVTCEVQIRTFLQDSWAKQTHHDLYKGARVGANVRKLSKSLARLLDAGDKIAQQIREEVSRKRPQKGALPEAVTEQGLGLIYQRAFGEAAPDYLLQIARHRCEEEGIDRLDALDRLLGDKSFRQSLSDAYTEATTFHVDGYQRTIVFQFAPMALRHGVDAAIKAIRRRAGDDNAEIEGIYRHEALSDIPDSFDEFMEIFEARDKDDDPEERIVRYASAFGATSRCASCSTVMLSEYDFAGDIQKYYGVKGHDDDILQALWNSGVECDGVTCTYCSNALSKD